MGCGNSKAAAVTQPHAATAPVRQNSPTVWAPYFVICPLFCTIFHF